MTWTGFTSDDFDVFSIPGLEPRMDALKQRIRPKLEGLGEALQPHLTQQLGEEVFVHVAKHARRTVHPPDETWVAWAANKRGYKAHPHFQAGLRQSGLFAMFALIYECKQKSGFAANFLEQFDEIFPLLPGHFVVSKDHTRPEVASVKELGPEGMREVLKRLRQVKKAEFLCGIQLDREDDIVRDRAALETRIRETFQTLDPLYRLAMAAQ
jgi:uncharacterized protein YktB (UPF0637 family)